MKKLIGPLLLGFGMMLAVVIGHRLSTDAMAVVLGVAVGLAASVPTSLLLVTLLRRERPSWHNEPPPVRYGPPVQTGLIVMDPTQVFGGRPTQSPAVPLPPPHLSTEAGLRRVRVVGADDDWSSE